MCELHLQNIRFVVFYKVSEGAKLSHPNILSHTQTPRAVRAMSGPQCPRGLPRRASAGARSPRSSPVALHFGAVFLDVPELAAGVALLLISVVAVAGQVAGLAAVVAALLPLPLGLLAVLGDVAASAAVIAGILLKVTVLGKVTRLSTAITDVWKRRGDKLETSIQGKTTSATASHSTTAASTSGALPGPVARPSALEVLVAAHGCSQVFRVAGARSGRDSSADREGSS